MYFEIPYVNFEVIDDTLNLFNWNNDLYSNNSNTGYWVYENDKIWHYKSNTPIIIEGYYEEGINGIRINNDSYNLNSSNNSISKTLENNQYWTSNNVMIKDNSSNKISFNIEIKTNEGYIFEFIYDLETADKFGEIEISELDDGNENDIS